MEITKLNLELQDQKSRVLQLQGRLDLLTRREKTLEDMVVYRTDLDAQGSPHEVFDHFELVQPGAMTPEQFDVMAQDLTTFLTYISEPAQLKRQSLGIKVILFLVVLFLFSFLYKKELWKDVH